MALLPTLAGASNLGQVPGLMRRLGAGRMAGLGFLAELAWAFCGSLGFGLGQRPAVAGATVTWLYLASAVALAALTGFAVWLAGPGRPRPD